MDIESIPKDEAHAKYRSAMIHMKAALANGKSVARTRLVVNSIPMMEFYHRVFDEAQTCYAEATVKIAAVDEQIRLLPDWESSICGQMSQFIINKGEIAT